MNTRVLVSLALLVGIGAVLHAVIPGFFFGMKPDMMLTMMFLGILLVPSKKTVGLLGIVTGIISGVTTSFPGGLLPNMVDKPITAIVFAALLLLVKKYSQSVIAAAILTAVGTVVSGAVFLTAALLLVGLPGGATFSGLFAAVVLPAVVVNTIAMVIIYPIVQSIFKRANLAAQP
ncbi:tryptophan transporter TrpP [Anoxybacillus vitaminiphilus]|uniref:Tryptophan transporter TrpP n=1 Tax=Paranoxybacillus vitaminiphilus TaxID=581036 RepID=A0A327YEM4_9BACL|nr:tryptophan transporter [Anoxybacillus vitaminiphilus]RAK19480.1 tryptophan transporter TrpP [Anoxybacillus vitaminiphilus]